MLAEDESDEHTRASEVIAHARSKCARQEEGKAAGVIMSSWEFPESYSMDG